MILLDWRGLVLNEVFSYANFLKTGEFDEELFIQSVIITVGHINKKFRNEFGELVICNDCRKSDYWRKKLFPNYKVNRDKQDIYTKKFRDAEVRDRMRKMSTIILDIIKDNLTFKVITVKGAEADDVIGSLIYRFPEDKHVIVSKDQDFFQLQRFDVKQYAWTKSHGGWKAPEESPIIDLKNKILKGDNGDGIPNVLSPINSLADGIKQNRLNMKHRLELIDTDVEEYEEEIYNRFKMNEILIDLSKTPPQLGARIIEEYETSNPSSFSSLMSNMMKLRYRKCIENLNLFKVMK